MRRPYIHTRKFTRDRPLEQGRITRDKYWEIVRSERNQANLKRYTSVPSLVIHIDAYGMAFHVKVSYYKFVYDSLSGESDLAVVWSKFSTGTHGKDPGFILSTLAQLMDQFLVEYLRVNEEACRSR